MYHLILSTLLIATPAMADDIYDAPGLIELLPSPDIVGDGVMPVTMYVVALNSDGTPYDGLTLKSSAKGAETGEWRAVSPAIYSFTFTPDRVEAPAIVRLKLKGRDTENNSIKIRKDLTIHPPFATQLTASVNPTSLHIGRDASATVTFSLVSSEEQRFAPEDLDIRVSSGELSPLTDMGDGRFTAKYTPPETESADIAVFTATNRHSPERVYASFSLPLSVTKDITIKTTPHATVLLDIGGSKYGPVTTDKRGKAKVSATLRPQDKEGVLTTLIDGVASESTLSVADSTPTTVQIVPMAASIPANHTITVPIRVAAYTTDGTPDTENPPTLNPTKGSITPLQHEGRGIYMATYTPTDLSESTPFTFEATHGESPTSSHPSELVGVRAAKVLVAPPENPLKQGDTLTNLTYRLEGPTQMPLTNRDLTLYPTGGNVKKDEAKDGTHTVTFTTNGLSDLSVVGVASTPVSHNPFSHLLLFADNDHLPNNGISENLITVVSVDANGYPVPNTDVTLSFLGASGSLPDRVTTNEHGVGTVFFTAGRNAGLVRLLAVAGASRTTLAFLQSPPLTTPVSLPTTGTEEDIAEIQAWREVVTQTHIKRE